MTTNNNISCNIEDMDLTNLSKIELLTKCEELGIIKCKSKNKGELIELINSKNTFKNEEENNIISVTPLIILNPENNEVSIPSSFLQKGHFTLVDLFCGTGAFSYAFHKTNKVTTLFANDMLDSSEKIFNLNNLH